jgi:predicted AAA+ superfamily ATPase
MKMNHYKERSIYSKFWRSKQQQEVDYVETEHDDLRGYEMKFNATQKARITKAFTNMYPDAKTEIITPDNFINFIS